MVLPKMKQKDIDKALAKRADELWNVEIISTVAPIVFLLLVGGTVMVIRKA